MTAEPTRKALNAARAIMDQAHFSDGSLCGKPYPVLRNNAEIKAVALALDQYAAARVEAERERIAEIVKQFETPYALTNAEAFGWEHCRDKAVLAIRSGDQP